MMSHTHKRNRLGNPSDFLKTGKPRNLPGKVVVVAVVAMLQLAIKSGEVKK